MKQAFATHEWVHARKRHPAAIWTSAAQIHGRDKLVATQGANVTKGDSGQQLRLAELLGSLSLATDLGSGFPLEKALRNCRLATSTGRVLGPTGQELSDVYYAGLLRMIGCTAFAAEEAAAFGGDDIAFRQTYAPVDFGDPDEVVAETAAHLPPGGPSVEDAGP